MTYSLEQLIAELHHALDGFEQFGDPAALKHCRAVISALLNHPDWDRQAPSERADQLFLGGGILLNLFRFEPSDGHLQDGMSLTSAALSIIKAEPFDGSTEVTSRLLNNLGLMKRNLARRDNDPEGLRDAVNTLRRAVAIGSPDDRDGYPERLSNLGAALMAMFLKAGDLMDLEEAIASFRLAYSLNNRGDFANHLGACFELRYRTLGRRSDLEAAIALARKASETIEAGHASRAGVQSNLAIYLGARLSIDGNLLDAQEAILAATEAVDATAQGAPLLAARLAVLGNLHAVIFQRTSAPQESVAAIACLEEALAQSRNDAAEAARIKINLSLALSSSDLAATTESYGLRACQLAREALVVTDVDAPTYLLCVNALSEALRQRGRFTKTASPFLEAADLVRTALAQARPFATDRTKIGLNLAHTLLDAVDAGADEPLLEDVQSLARRAIADLMSQALRAAMPADDIDHATRLATRLALKLIAGGDLSAAAVFFEQSRSVRLSADAAAAARAVEFANPDDKAKFDKALSDLREQRTLLDTLAADAARDQPAFATAMQEVERLTALAEEIGARSEAPLYTRDTGQMLEHAAALAGPLGYVYATPAQAGLLLVTAGGYHHLALDELREGARHLRTGDQYAPADLFAAIKAGTIAVEDIGWLPAYALHTSEVSDGVWRNLVWRDAIARTLEWLDQAFGAPVLAFLQTLRVSTLTLLPIGEIGLLPLHASGDSDGPLMAKFMVRYAPSASMLAIAVDRAPADTESRLVVADIEGDLPYARLEALAVSGGGSWLAGTDARRDEIVSGLGTAGYSHLAVHAIFDARFPLASKIETAPDDDERAGISLAEILSGEVRVKSGATVVASACETGVFDVARIPSEQLGFAGALIASGARNVVATLWPVADLSSALIMQKAAEAFDGASSIPQSILNAALWLRKASGSDIKVSLQTLQSGLPDGDTRFDRVRRAIQRFVDTLDDDNLPFAHPAFWAPYIALGA